MEGVFLFSESRNYMRAMITYQYIEKCIDDNLSKNFKQKLLDSAVSHLDDNYMNTVTTPIKCFNKLREFISEDAPSDLMSKSVLSEARKIKSDESKINLEDFLKFQEKFPLIAVWACSVASFKLIVRDSF